MENLENYKAFLLELLSCMVYSQAGKILNHLIHVQEPVKASMMCLPPEESRGSILTENSMHLYIKQNKLYLYFHQFSVYN